MVQECASIADLLYWSNGGEQIDVSTKESYKFGFYINFFYF